ncbi:hypothetical protein TIFTF001_013911 [Ficus carica]|uniref:Putative plant transposon protein domain-containing protein n=1 Tax=Ficus carica TaxID=3494 RepID=A0AA88A2T7_FICCA|nr:hypothetical protein TIFTF001_013911 [Ficus carica]
MSQRKFLCERTISIADDDNLGLVDFLKERDIRVPSSPRFCKVYVREHVFEISSTKIDSYLECPIIPSNKAKELDQEVDMNSVTSFLTSDLESKWPGSREFLSCKLLVKFSVLHKIALAVWLPYTHAMNVSRDLAVLLYNIGAVLEFDMGKRIFKIIVRYGESKSSYAKLPFPTLDQ